MKDTFMKIKDKIRGLSEKDYDYPDEFNEDYLEINMDTLQDNQEPDKIMVRPYLINEFADVKAPLQDLRTGRTIVLLDVGPLKGKDLVELKRAINKIKRTCDALEGDIVGFGENWIVATPSCARVSRN